MMPSEPLNGIGESVRFRVWTGAAEFPFRSARKKHLKGNLETSLTFDIVMQAHNILMYEDYRIHFG